MAGLTWRQTILRNRLVAIETCLQKPEYDWMNKEQLEHDRRECIRELNRVQLEEWNYD